MNHYNPNIHHRRSIRLKGYDYSRAGLYFITICVQDRACLFGEIVVGASLVDALMDTKPDAQMILNDAGKMVESEWLKLPKRFKNIELHEYIVMPNHFHAILEIVGATLVVAQNSNAQNESITQNEMVDDIGLDIGRLLEDGRPRGTAPTVNKTNEETDKPKKNKTVGDMVGAFESIVTVEYIRGVKQYNWPRFNGKLWQRNYWEHIIRNEPSYQRISDYIKNNPAKWANDKFYKNK